MIVGTTPTLTLKLKRTSDADLNMATNIYVTLKQGNILLTKTGQDIELVDGKTLRISLTQSESLDFSVDKKVELQLNWTYLEGGQTKRAATKVISIDLERQLLKEAIQ